MGTNFFIKNEPHLDLSKFFDGYYEGQVEHHYEYDEDNHTRIERLDWAHIGKRSAAGSYCWDCRRTLCKAGEDKIHFHEYNDWYDKCPNCGKEKIDEPLELSVMGRELGFNKNKPGKKEGVSSCCSFSWALESDIVLKIIEKLSNEYGKKYVVVDEYSRKYTLEDFYSVLDECPVRYNRSLRQIFS